MRKISIFFAVISIFASCNSDQKTETTKDVVGVSDSTSYKNNTMADTGHFAPAPVPVVPPVIEKTKPVVTAKAPRLKVTPKRITPQPATTPVTTNTDTKPVTPAPATQGTVTPTETGTTSTTPAPAPAKKGWSSAAKDATIGGVGGAIGGAILSKKKGKGAIIGGAIGAAGGYILGRKKDKARQAQDTLK